MDVISSFFQNIKDKLTNPFFGTLAFILIIHHWDFWFTLFNFDDKISRVEKLAILKCIATFEFTRPNIFVDVLWAFGIVIIGYLVVVATRALSIWIEYQVMPLITNSVASELIISKHDYDEVVKERNDYSEKYEVQRKLVREYSTISDKQNEQIKEVNEEFTTQTGVVNSLTETTNQNQKKILKQSEDINDLNSKLSNAKVKIKDISNDFDNQVRTSANLSYQLELFESLFIEENSMYFYNDISKFPPTITNKVKQLKDENMWNIFLDVDNFLKSRRGGVSSTYITSMQEHGIITHYDEWKYTPVGLVISKYRDLFMNY